MSRLVCSLVASLYLILNLVSPSAHAAPQGAAAFAGGTAGVGPSVDVINDLGLKPEFTINSFWATGDFTVGTRKLNYIYNIFVINDPARGGVVVQSASITDSSTGVYHSEATTTPLSLPIGTASSLNAYTPTGSIVGNFDNLRVKASMPGGSFDLTLKASGPALYNGGTGVWPLLGGTAREYSIPWMATTGTITLDGVTYNVKGNSWFDRQWQSMDGIVPPIKWTWMRMNLSNGDALSIWSIYDAKISKQRGWVTILHADGSQSVAAVEPTLGATNYWTSSLTGSRFAGAWTVRIPQFDAVLTVTPQPVRQEIVAPAISEGTSEAASMVTGIYKGKPITGNATVEQLGSQ